MRATSAVQSASAKARSISPVSHLCSAPSLVSAEAPASESQPPACITTLRVSAAHLEPRCLRCATCVHDPAGAQPESTAPRTRGIRQPLSRTPSSLRCAQSGEPLPRAARDSAQERRIAQQRRNLAVRLLRSAESLASAEEPRRGLNTHGDGVDEQMRAPASDWSDRRHPHRPRRRWRPQARPP
jgi:hypothetical protein